VKDRGGGGVRSNVAATKSHGVPKSPPPRRLGSPRIAEFVASRVWPYLIQMIVTNGNGQAERPAQPVRSSLLVDRAQNLIHFAKDLLANLQERIRVLHHLLSPPQVAPSSFIVKIDVELVNDLVAHCEDRLETPSVNLCLR